MKTRSIRNKNCRNFSRNWLSAVKFAETRRIRLAVSANCDLYHYAGNNPVKYTDPDGREVKGMVRGALKITLATLEMKSGMGMLAAAVAGEFFTVGLSTGASVALGTAGVVTMVDGANRFGLAIADFVAETADTFGAKVIDGELLPSSLGGAIGAVIDKSNNECFSDTGKIGPSQKMGEKINASVSYITSTLDYTNTVKTASSNGEVITNEIMQQYNNYDTVKTLSE